MDFVPRFVYTYQIVEDDLVIYTWEFQNHHGDSLLYKNKTNGYTTMLDFYGDPRKFCEENDVFLDRVEVLADLGEVVYDDDDFELGEAEMDVVINLFGEEKE